MAGVRSGDAVLVPALICNELVIGLDALGANALWYPVDQQLRLAVDPRSLRL